MKHNSKPKFKEGQKVIGKNGFKYIVSSNYVCNDGFKMCMVTYAEGIKQGQPAYHAQFENNLNDY